MLKPNEVKAKAVKLEKQNWDFRTFLKWHADDEELDSQFLALHNELFASYDCCKCNNCCRAYRIILSIADVARISGYLGMSENAFYNEYLEPDENDSEGNEQFAFEAKPCVFLEKDGRCRIQDVKPSDCMGYPYTNQPDRLSRMIAVIEFSETCPVVFEILERLKKIYSFRKR